MIELKKKVIIGLLVISALSFGAINNSGETKDHHKDSYSMGNQLSENQQAELRTKIQEKRKNNYKMGLDIESKNIELKKLLNEDKINWKSVENLNTEISDLKAEQRLENLKFSSSIKEEYGVNMMDSYNGYMRDRDNNNGSYHGGDNGSMFQHMKNHMEGFFHGGTSCGN